MPQPRQLLTWTFIERNFPLKHHFHSSHKFLNVVFHFHLSQSIFWFPLFLLWSTGLKICCSISTILLIFLFSFCYWFLIPSCWNQRRHLVKYLSFKIYWDLICGLTYCLSWKMPHVLWRRMCMFLLLGRVLCICVRSRGYTIVLRSLFLYLTSIWLFYPS